MSRTLAQLAKEAIEIQDACNLSGLVHGWHRSIIELREELGKQGIFDTDKINQHPINVMWVSKLADLAHYDGSMTKFSFAYDACQELADERASMSTL